MKGFDAYLKCLEQHGLERTHHVLIVAIGEKNLHLLDASGIRATFPISYGKRPMSCQANSLGTPWGLHEVGAKIGDGEPDGMIFKGRVPTGQRWHERSDAGPAQENFVTTRILRLRGLEPGLNAGNGIDSFDRYIYIHGTNHPHRFPENISSGCLLMRDDDLIRLFDAVEEGTHVFIDRSA